MTSLLFYRKGTFSENIIENENAWHYNIHQPFYNAGVQEDKFTRRRKKTNSGCRSRHSSCNSNKDEDYIHDSVNGEIDIHQLENEAFIEGHEVSDSFSIEFESSRNNRHSNLPKTGIYTNFKEDSASNSIVFRHSDSSQIQVGSDNSLFWSEFCRSLGIYLIL